MADGSILESFAKTRREAKALGAKWYLTGEPCSRGHFSKRSTARGSCNECRTLEFRYARYRRPEDEQEWKAKYWAKPENRARRLANMRANKTGRNKRRYNRRKALRELLADRPKPDTCDVCSSVGDSHGIHFDHCHMTAQFRGWLCGRCNVALAMARDNPQILRKLADYVEGHNKRHPQADWVKQVEFERVIKLK